MAINENDLQRFVDGQLDPARAAEVEEHLVSDRDSADRVAAYRQQNDALHALFDPVLEEPVPSGLLAKPRSRWPLLRHAAVLAWLALGGVAGWALRGAFDVTGPHTATLARQAAIAHAVYVPEVRHPVEVGADQEKHLVAWLSKRLGAEVRAPNLGGLGFGLVGGRLLPSGEGPAAQFMYQDGEGHRLTLYVRRGTGANRETAFRFAQESGVGVFYWVEGPLGYALSGDLDKSELLRVANAVYSQLNP